MAAADLTQESVPPTPAVAEPVQSALSGIEARERYLLASAIHDDPMQLIVASMLQIDYLRMAPGVDDEDAWEKVIAMLETSVERLRLLIAALTPADLADGLGEALHHLALGIFMGTATTVTVRTESSIRLSTEQATLAHQILREALLNARQHARAGTVELRLEQADRFVATVTDDGIGNAGTGGRGLAAMRELAHSAGGDLRVDSPPGVGTTVTLSLTPG